MTIRRLVLVCLLVFSCGAYAQFGKIKIPGTGRITGSRGSSGTPQVVGVEGTAKVDATREVVIKVENVSVGMMGSLNVEARRPCEVVSHSKLEDEKIKVTVRVTGETHNGFRIGADRCDFTIKVFKSRLDQYPANEFYASVKVEPSDELLEQQRKQEQQIADMNAQAAEAQAQYEKAKPQIQNMQKNAVGRKWTVKWANGKSEVWTYSGMDNMTNMANFKNSAGGELKIMYGGMFYTIMRDKCGLMASEEGGKVSGKPAGGECDNMGAFTASID